jgi:hypothetical protein
VGIAVVASLVLIIIWRAGSGENQGKLIVNEFASTAPTNTVNKNTLQTAFFTLVYPNAYKQTNSNSAMTTGEVQTVLLKPSVQDVSGASQIGVTYRKLTGSLLTEDSTYRLYQAHPETYQFEAPGEDGTVIVRKKTLDTYEQTRFIPHADSVLILDLTSTDTGSMLDDLMNSIIKSLHWL